MVSKGIRSITLKNKKAFIKQRYHIQDVVWWIDARRIQGIIYDSNETYCYIRDEDGNEYIKPHIELYLDETSVIEFLLNETMNRPRFNQPHINEKFEILSKL